MVFFYQACHEAQGVTANVRKEQIITNGENTSVSQVGKRNPKACGGGRAQACIKQVTLYALATSKINQKQTKTNAISQLFENKMWWWGGPYSIIFFLMNKSRGKTIGYEDHWCSILEKKNCTHI